MTGQSQPTSPMVLVDTDIEAEAFTRARGSTTTAETMLRESNAALDTAIEEMGGVDVLGTDRMRLSNIQSISGGDGEKVAKLVELHSHIAAATRAIAEVRALAGTARWREQQDTIRAGLGQTALPEHDIVGANRSPFQALVHAMGGAYENGAHWARGVTDDVRGHSIGRELLATVFRTTAGFPPENLRSGRIELAQIAQPELFEVMGSVIPTNQNSYIYLAETIGSDATTTAAEGAEMQESQLSLAEVTKAITKLAAYLPVTDEQLADEPSARAYVDNRLIYLARRKLNGEIGGATKSDAAGFNTQASGKEGATFVPDNPLADARKAMTKVRVAGEAIPTNAALHPTAWELCQLSATTAGEFLWGRPAEALTNRLWGLPVTEDASMGDNLDAWAASENWGMIGDFAAYSALVMRQDAQIAVGWIGDDFKKGQQSIRVTLRAVPIFFRPKAFTQLVASA